MPRIDVIEPIERQPLFAVGLVFSALLLLPFGRSVELPTLIMAILGGALLWQRRGALYADPGQRLFAILFLAVWLPMLLSALDAVHLPKTLNDSLVFPRLYLAGVFVIWALRAPGHHDRLIRLTAYLVGFWLCDALIQAVVGMDLFGHPYTPGRLNGIYGRHLDFGVALPVLAPFLLYALRERPVGLLIAAVLTAAVVLLAGSRGGWMSYAVVCAGLAHHLLRQGRVRAQQVALGAMLLGAVVGLVAWQHPDARARVDVTLGVLSGEGKEIDAASSGRVTIWATAARMLAGHPFNGIGVGSFRYAYPQYAGPGDVFVDANTGTGAFYAHQLVIQVLSETGVIGLIGLLMFFWLWWRSWRDAPPAQRGRALPYALAALAWLFPLNTHASFYGAQWSQLIWLMLALYCAALFTTRREGG
ncbi:MAG: O-antigen ligase family protein [Thiobacillaceae bacterium]